jgi:hypothetical protein
MDDATHKLMQNCSRDSATPSTAMRLDHLMTGEKYSDKKMEHILEQSRGVVCSEDIIHPDKTTASNLLKVLGAMPNHICIALIHYPKSDILLVKNTRVYSGAQHFTLLTKLKGKKPTTKHAPCKVNVTDENLVKSTMKLDETG